MLSLQLYKTLRKHQELAEKRSPMLSQGRMARFIGYIVMSIVAIYLIGFSIMLSLIAIEDKTMTAYELMYSIIPIIYTIDFYVRFSFQQTPTQQVKPYILLPISRNSCIDFFICRQLLSWGNLTLMMLYVPFAIMTILFCEGILTTILFLLGFYIIELIVCQIYSIIRSKINENLVWWLLIIPLSAIVFSPMIFCEGSTMEARFSALINAYGELGTYICNGNLIAWISLLAILAILIIINRSLQYSLVYKEISKTEKTITAKAGKSLEAINRFGIIGKFIKLEMLSIRRNKTVRKMFLVTNAIVLVFSLLCSFTSVYDDMSMTQFWMIYSFAIYGTRMVIRSMSFEGNYMEVLLMGHRTIEYLLRSKYYIYSVILIIPLIMLLPMVIMGKASMTALVSTMIFTAGVDNFLFMKMLIYNKETMPLNEKFTGKMKVENNWVLIVVELSVFILPILFIKTMSIFMDEIITFIILALIGIVFIASHKYWVSRIYNSLTERKYKNLESMIATRSI